MRRNGPELPRGSVSARKARAWQKKLGTSFDNEEFRRGLEVEYEHAATVGGSAESMARIAVDHLEEDPQYYSKLDKPFHQRTNPSQDLETLPGIRKVVDKALAKFKVDPSQVAVKFARGGVLHVALGATRFVPSTGKIVIRLDKVSWPTLGDGDRREVILHETAHAIQYALEGKSDHKAGWKSIAKKIGCSGTACVAVKTTKPTREAPAPKVEHAFQAGDAVSFKMPGKRKRYVGVVESTGPLRALVRSGGWQGRVPYRDISPTRDNPHVVEQPRMVSPHYPNLYETVFKVEVYDTGRTLDGVPVSFVGIYKWTTDGGYQSMTYALLASDDPLDDHKMIGSMSSGMRPIADADKLPTKAWEWAEEQGFQKVLGVGEAIVVPGLQGQGWGQLLYWWTLRDAGLLYSDSSVSKGAMGVWKRLVDRAGVVGKATKGKDRNWAGTLKENPPAIAVYEREQGFQFQNLHQHERSA